MTRLRCVTMQRDETDQLEGWLGHHGYLAGFENLTVFDNGSTERRTIEILRRFARVGTRVIWEHRQDDDYAARDIHFDNLSRQWSGEAAATVGVLLEADERLALFSAHGLSCRRSEIEACLARPFADGESFTLDLGLRACADHPGFFRAEPLARRLVVRGDVGSAEAAGAAGRLEDLTVVATGLDGIGGRARRWSGWDRSRRWRRRSSCRAGRARRRGWCCG